MQTERRRPEAGEASECAAATSEAAGWIEWNGRHRPVPAGQMVEVRLHNSEQYKDLAGEIRWSMRNERDVARYRVVPA